MEQGSPVPIIAGVVPTEIKQADGGMWCTFVIFSQLKHKFECIFIYQLSKLLYFEFIKMNKLNLVIFGKVTLILYFIQVLVII